MSSLPLERSRIRRARVAVLLGFTLFGAIPAYAQQSQATSAEAPTEGADHDGHANQSAEATDRPSETDPMAGMDMSTPSTASAPMTMGSMQGGKPPPDARDPDAFADGYENSALPGFEKADQIQVDKLLVDELEFFSGTEGDGLAWSAQVTSGGDNDKLWIRSQGLKISGQTLDSETGAEALWWHATGPFWGRTLGLRQDIGRGAHSWLAAGVEGLAPYWFDVALTAYLGDDGRLAARAKASYDLLLTNRLILTPQLEANAYSVKDTRRGLGSGVSSAEFGLRLRYEIARKIAPYVGFVWERSLGGTADLRRARQESAGEGRLVAGIRLWW